MNSFTQKIKISNDSNGEIEETTIKDFVKNFVSQAYKFDIPDKYFDEIKDKLNYEKSLQITGKIYRYINEILVLNLKDKITTSHLKKYTKSDTIWRKSIFMYLEEAERLYVKGHSSAGIFFCRLAIEVALRDRIIKRRIKLKKITNLSAEENRLSKLTLGPLLDEARRDSLNILNSKDSGTIFKKLKGEHSQGNILNKFIHGDYLWMKDFLGV